MPHSRERLLHAQIQRARIEVSLLKAHPQRWHADHVCLVSSDSESLRVSNKQAGSRKRWQNGTYNFDPLVPPAARALGGADGCLPNQD